MEEKLVYDYLRTCKLIPDAQHMTKVFIYKLNNYLYFYNYLRQTLHLTHNVNFY